MMSPSDLATPVLNAFQNVSLAVIIERQTNKVPSSEVTNEFYDLLPIPSCTSWSSSTKTRYGKYVDFPCHSTNSNPHCVLRAITVLKEDEKISLLVSSSPIKRAKYETCKFDVNHHGR